MSGEIKFEEVVIANGASKSTVIELNGSFIVSLVMPSAWTAADLSLIHVDVNGDETPVYVDGAEKTITAQAGVTIDLPPADSGNGFHKLKLRSGTSAAAVNQTAERTIQVGRRAFQ